nr:immunoglobulin light chain junction region [Macaca mulatta]MOV84506.1 immunoglobulin light chain junction region [Macaca mulatta]
CMQGIDYPYSF